MCTCGMEHCECPGHVVALREVDGDLVPVVHRVGSGGERIERRSEPQELDEDERLEVVS